MGYLLKQGQTAQPLVFLVVDSTSHITGLTGATPTVTISKNGGAFAAPAGAVTELANGWYRVAGNATDANTLGPLLLHAEATGADPVDREFHVVGFNPSLAWTGNTGVVVDAESKAGYVLNGSGLDAVLVETNLNARQALAVISAATAGVLSGAATTSIAIAGAGVATTRLEATVDSSGNRTAVTLTPPA